VGKKEYETKLYEHFKPKDFHFEDELLSPKTKRSIWKQREYSLPKHLEKFLRKHTVK
jgi:hypothetical protein